MVNEMNSSQEPTRLYMAFSIQSKSQVQCITTKKKEKVGESGSPEETW
jgi:hypothetical protein